MIYLLIALHILVCLFLIIVVLLQSGKAADLAGAFGGMGSQTAFGPRGAATLLSKATTMAAVAFMFTSILLSISAARRGGGTAGSVLDKEKTTKAAPATAPKTPAKPGSAAPVPASAPTPAPATGGVDARAGELVDVQLVPPGGKGTKPGAITLEVQPSLPGDKPAEKKAAPAKAEQKK